MTAKLASSSVLTSTPWISTPICVPRRRLSIIGHSSSRGEAWWHRITVGHARGGRAPQPGAQPRHPQIFAATECQEAEVPQHRVGYGLAHVVEAEQMMDDAVGQRKRFEAGRDVEPSPGVLRERAP